MNWFEIMVFADRSGCGDLFLGLNVVILLTTV